MTEPLPVEQKHQLHAELADLFDSYELSVAVGITRTGITILSQDERVDASNIGPVEAYRDVRNGVES